MHDLMQQGVCFLDWVLACPHYDQALLTIGSSKIVRAKQRIIFPKNCIVATHDAYCVWSLYVFHKHPSSLRKARPSPVILHVRPYWCGASLVVISPRLARAAISWSCDRAKSDCSGRPLRYTRCSTSFSVGLSIVSVFETSQSPTLLHLRGGIGIQSSHPPA